MSSNIDLCKKLLNNFKSKSPSKREMDFDDLDNRPRKPQRQLNHINQSKSRFDDFDADDEEIKNKPDSVVIGTSNKGNIAFKTALDPYNGINYFPDVRCLVVGIPGSGKSFLTRVMIEKFCESNPGIIIVIDPENEYISLRENFQFVTFGKDEDCDLTFDENTVASLAEKIVENKSNCIFNLFDFDRDQRCNILTNFLQVLLTLPKEKQHPIVLFIDEIHLFAEKSTNDAAPLASKNILKLVNNIGRKRGISTIMITQRVTQLNAEIVSSCNSYLIGKTINIPDIKRNGELLGIKGKAANQIFKNLNYTFLSYGTVFDHSNLGEPVKFRSLKPETKHLSVAERRLYKFPDPFPQTQRLIEVLSGKNYKNPNISQIQSAPTSNLSTTKKLDQLKSESPAKKYESIIQTFKKISIKDLFVLSLQKNYSEIAASFEIQMLISKEWKNKYELGEGVIYYIDDEKENERQSSGKLPEKLPQLLSSREYIELWKTELNDYMFDKLIDYLFEDENCNNEFYHIEKFTGLSKQQVSELCLKYSSLNLISKDAECVYLNAIFFAKQIHESLPANYKAGKSDDDFEDFIDEELAIKEQEDETKSKFLEKSKDSEISDDEFDDDDDGEWDEDD